MGDFMTTFINASNSSGLTFTSDTSGNVTFQSQGANVLSFNTSGYVSTPLQPKFYGYRTAGLVSATTTVLHNVVVTNVGSCYNSSTGIFTVPIAGYYEIFAGGHGENSQPVIMQIQQNGTAVCEEFTTGTAYGSITAFAIVSCAANDQLKNVVTSGTMWGGSVSGLRMSVKYLG
jgi:hypothetical protein